MIELICDEPNTDAAWLLVSPSPFIEPTINSFYDRRLCPTTLRWMSTPLASARLVCMLCGLFDYHSPCTLPTRPVFIGPLEPLDRSSPLHFYFSKNEGAHEKREGLIQCDFDFSSQNSWLLTKGSNTNWSIWIPRERWKIQIRERRNSIAADLSRQVQLHSWNVMSLQRQA